MEMRKDLDGWTDVDMWECEMWSRVSCGTGKDEVMKSWDRKRKET